jgi:putative FmdB family regulatory protein
MPFYEYQCPHCGYDEEVLQKITDKPLTKCPKCGKKGLRKLMSAPVFRLKGSGWYETDFKSDKENKRNLAGAEKEEAKSEAKTDAKADAKPDTKTDTKTDAKTDSKPAAAKVEAAKPEAAKPEKASPSARKSAPRARHKSKRTAKRQARR